MENQYGVGDSAGSVTDRLAQGHVVEAKHRKSLARPELEVVDSEITLVSIGRRRLGGGAAGKARQQGRHESCEDRSKRHAVP
jgi:hypothetical protein